MRGMQVFRQMRRAGHPGVPIDTVVAVAVLAFFVFLKENVVIADEFAQTSAALVQDHMVEAIEFALWVEVHFAHGLCVVSRTGEFAGQRGRVLERVRAGHRETAMVPLIHAREDARAGGGAGGDGGVGVVETRAALGQFIQVGGFEYRVAVAPEAVAALLVGCNQEKVRSWSHTGSFRLTGRGDECVAPAPACSGPTT